MYGKRYWTEYTVWFLIFVASIGLVRLVAKSLPVDSPLRLLSIAAPALAVMGGFWVELRNLRRIDELQRQIYLESLFYGMGAMMLFVAVATLLEDLIGAPRLSSIWTVIANGVGCIAGLLIARSRYR